MAGEVIDVARALAAQGHHEEVLRAALSWCSEVSQENLSERAMRRRRKVGAMLFLELAKPVTPTGLPLILDGSQAAKPAYVLPGWRAIFDFHGTPGLWNAAIEMVICQWLNAALRHPRVRERITAIIVAAAGPLVPFGDVHGTGLANPNPASAKLVIGIVQRWAAISPVDPIRTGLRDDIVIALTRPLWRRLLRMLCAKARLLIVRHANPRS